MRVYSGVIMVVTGFTAMYFKVAVEPALLGATLSEIVIAVGVYIVLFAN